ncbi:MAG: AAA family ATPase, partial [Thermoprotei archaeon]
NKIIEDRRKTLEKINVSELKTKLSELRGKRDELDKALRELRKLRESLESEREKLSVSVSELSLKIGELRSKAKVINEKEKELESKKEKLNAILSELGLGSVGRVSEFSDELKKRKSSLESEYSNVSKEVKELDETLKSIEAGEGEVLVQVSRLEAEIENTKSKVREVWSEVQEMRDLVARGVCPLCKQSITREHGEELVKERNRKMREVAIGLVPLIKELWAKKLLQLKLSNKKEEIEKMRNELSKRQEEILRELRGVDAGILRLNQVIELRDEISRLEQEVSRKTKILEELSIAEKEFKNLSKRIDDLRNELNKVKESEVDYSKRLGEVSEQIINLESKLREYSELSNELRELESRASFLAKISEYLINHVYKGVETIENFARSLAHEKFSEYFHEYFARLLEDQELVEASVRDFKPSVRVRASSLVEREISQPSGAQLTALGLAYRLALNRVVRDLSRELKDSVLIMDEPTLGFSPERVEKLRELIEFIGSDSGRAQVILVTHDEKLLEVGDCRIRLSINNSKNETLVDYEECVMKDEDLDFQQYKNFIYSILSK